jgi:hypothetical protein
MPDRIVGFTQEISAGGETVTFSDGGFYAVPEIGIGVLDGQEGDNYTITSRSEASFFIAFTNGGSNVTRTITGIAKAYGLEEAA